MSYPLEDPRNPWAYRWFMEGRCPKCGEPVSPTDNYCPNCGYRLRHIPSEKHKKNDNAKGLAAAYILSLLIGIPISIILFRNICYDSILGFNYFLFAFLTLTIGTLLGFLSLLVIIILIISIRKAKNK